MTRPKHRQARAVVMLLALAACTVISPITLFYSPALAQEAPDGRPAATSDPAVVKQKLRDILAQPEFAAPNHEDSEIVKDIRAVIEKLQTEWNRFTDWLSRWWDRIKQMFSFGGLAGSTSNIVVWVFIAACVLACGFFLLKYVRQSRKQGKRRELTPSSALMDVEFRDALTRSAEEWIGDAANYAEEGDFRRAIRASFLSMLVQLDSSGLLEYSRSATNGDYLDFLVTERPAGVSAPFRRMAIEFDYVWYGEKGASEAEYRAYMKDYEAITQAVRVSEHTTLELAGTAIAH